jgi:hypothetical protein
MIIIYELQKKNLTWQ